MARINNPLTPADVRTRATDIAKRDFEALLPRARSDAERVLHTFVLLVPTFVLIALGSTYGNTLVAILLGALYMGPLLGYWAALCRGDCAFLAAHPDLNLNVPDYVRVAYLRFSADAKAVAAADVPLSVRSDVDAAREAAEHLLVACHSDRPEDPDEAKRIQEASTELIRLSNEAEALHASVRQRADAISARVDHIDGLDASEVIARAQGRSLSQAAKTVDDETTWLAEHLDEVAERDPSE